ncbi:MAG TPA: VTT domain-containing protein [Gemmatimonadaceae bacterium]|nr:VTT domain-containing protein [Gemmatimonadaceae bacterium]
MSREPERPKASDWVRLVVPTVLLVALVVVAWRMGYFSLKDPQKLSGAVDRLQGLPWLPPAFVGVYAIAAALATPISPMAYGAGAVFGLLRGSIFVWIASLIGATAGYWLAREVWAGPAQRLLGRHSNMLQMLGSGGAFLNSLRVHLFPIMPFGILNYAAGTSRLAFVPFLAGTAIGVIPGTIAAVYVGDRLAAGIEHNDSHAFTVAAIVMLVLLALSFLPTLIRKLRGA